MVGVGLEKKSVKYHESNSVDSFSLGPQQSQSTVHQELAVLYGIKVIEIICI
jgi:hypothetical protein